jgi:ribosomal-protein-alanine N-acetyltransferase
MIPTLETVRLRIRPLVAEDLEDCHSLHVEIDWIDHELDLAANRAKRASWLAWTIDSYRELAGLHQPPYGERAVERRSDGVFLGLVGLVPSLAAFGQLPGFGARRDARVRPEVGLFWALRPSAQGSGFATEAAAALMAYARDELLVERLVATTERDNLASIAVMRRLGMVIEENAHPSSDWPQVVGVLDVN